MFCCNCGAKNLPDAQSCYSCGRILPKEVPIERPRNEPDDPERRLLAEKVFSIDQKLNDCHGCRSAAPVFAMDFGMSKIERKYDWPVTVASIGISALTLPLGLPGGVSWSYDQESRTIRCCLALCQQCAPRWSLRMHPWYASAYALGFTETTWGPFRTPT